MSYKVGQIRKNSSTSYLTDLNYTSTIVQTAGYANKIFNDYAISLVNNSFLSGRSYYVRFRIKRIAQNDERFNNYVSTNDINDPRQLVFKLQLFSHDGSDTDGEYEAGTYQVVNSNIAVQPYMEGINTEYFFYELVFTPNSNYNYLGFVLSRSTYDYFESTPRNDIATNIDFGVNGDVALVNNILTVDNATKIGIQTKPGTLVCINHEPIRVGRSGVYELNNGIKINYFGITAPNGEVDNFILDYAYDGE